MNSYYIFFINGIIVFLAGTVLLFNIGRYGLHQVFRKQFSSFSFSLFSFLISLGIIPIFLLPHLSFSFLQTVLGFLGIIVSEPDTIVWTKYWLNPPFLPACLGLVTGYYGGRYISRKQHDPVRMLNKARLLYEHCIINYGYWFPNGWPENAKNDIDKIEVLYYNTNRLMIEQEKNDISKPGGMWHEDEIKWAQRWMVYFYQIALFLSSANRYEESTSNLEQAQNYLKLYSTYNEATENELNTTRSQIFFLMGENKLKGGDKEIAKQLFNKSLAIDKPLNDLDGISTIENRLKLTK